MQRLLQMLPSCVRLHGYRSYLYQMCFCESFFLQVKSNDLRYSIKTNRISKVFTNYNALGLAATSRFVYSILFFVCNISTIKKTVGGGYLLLSKKNDDYIYCQSLGTYYSIYRLTNIVFSVCIAYKHGLKLGWSYINTIVQHVTKIFCIGFYI